MSSVPLTYSVSSSCTDSHGWPIVDSGFSSSQETRTLNLTGTLASVPQSSVVYGTVFENYPVAFPLGGVINTGLAVPPTWAATTVSRTNPSRPVIVPASLVRDILDLPSMVRDIGKLLMKPKGILTPKQLANQHLAIQFGWLPLIRDINQLLDIQSAVLKRHAELRRLYSGKGLKRRVTFYDESSSSTVSQTWNRPGVGLRYTHDVKLTRKMWATIRWKPLAAAGRGPTDDQMHKLARKVVLGLTPEGAIKGAWDLIPWTWLIDWFIDVGSVLTQNSNTVAASHSSMCLMNEKILTVNPTTIVMTGTGTSDVRYTGLYRQSNKTRLVSGALTSGFTMPYLDMGRLSIISSLFVQRFAR